MRYFPFFYLSNCSSPLSWVPESKGWEWKISSLDLFVTLYSNEWAFWGASTHCWIISNFIFTSIPKFFPRDLPSIHSSPNLYWSFGTPQSRCKTLHIALLNSMESMWMHFVKPPRTSLDATSSLKLVNCTTQLCVTWKPAEAALSPKVYAVNTDMEQYQSQYGKWKVSLSTTCPL